MHTVKTPGTGRRGWWEGRTGGTIRGKGVAHLSRSHQNHLHFKSNPISGRVRFSSSIRRLQHRLNLCGHVGIVKDREKSERGHWTKSYTKALRFSLRNPWDVWTGTLFTWQQWVDISLVPGNGNQHCTECFLYYEKKANTKQCRGSKAKYYF